MNNYDKKDFVFERDTGIEFQHAKPTEQPFKLSKNQFTVIPKLESVKAEEYNKKFEEMRLSMPKNLAYAGKFGKETIIPPGVSSRKPQPQQKDIPEIKSEPAPKAPAAVKETITLPPQNTNKSPAPPPKEQLPKPPATVTTKTEPEKPPVQEEPIVFYTGYEAEKDPFNDDTYKNQEFVIENNDKQKNTSIREKIKNTFHKLFSSSAEENDVFFDDEE